MTAQNQIQQHSEEAGMIQRQIQLISHANKCIERDNFICLFPHCFQMQEVIEHLKECPLRDHCEEFLCFTTRQIINHFNFCSQFGCNICLPLKNSGEIFSMPEFGNHGHNEEVSNAASTKDDREEISQDIRNITVKKIAEEIDARSNEFMWLREDTEKLVLFAEKLEAEICEKVKSRYEYFHAIASKIVNLKTQSMDTLIADIHEVQKTNTVVNSGSFNKNITSLKSIHFKELQKLNQKEPLNLNSQEPHKFWIDKIIHAVGCKSRRCKDQTCPRLKQSVQHSRLCSIRMNGGCNVCNRLVTLCRNHAHFCEEENCEIPFCFSIKQKIHFQNDAQR